MRLEIFGPAACGQARRGSEVGLIAAFQEHPGLRIAEVEDDMAKTLGVPVDLLAREFVTAMADPRRRDLIDRDRRVIYRRRPRGGTRIGYSGLPVSVRNGYKGSPAAFSTEMTGLAAQA